MPRLIRLLAWTALTVAALGAPARAQVQDVPLAGGGSEQVLYNGPAKPPAILLMFAGGDGTVSFNSAGQITGRLNGNFLMRTEQLWLAQGFGYATIGSPSSLDGRRHTPAYVAAIAAAVDYARSRGGNAPVWLVGTSMGSIAAANGAAHLPGRVAGVVLTSSVAVTSRAANESVFDSDLGAIGVPALVVSNRGDNCPIAGPGFAPNILAALARAPKKDVIYVESHQSQSEPCEAMSPHGYLGIEGDVVQRISAWIRANP
jgi:hypothetical protein